MKRFAFLLAALLALAALMPADALAQPGGVQRIKAGTNVTVTPSHGTGIVTIDFSPATITGSGAAGRATFWTSSSAVSSSASFLWDNTLNILTVPQLTASNTTNQIVLGVTNTTTISSLAPAASRTATIPALTGNDTFVFLAQAQTLTNKTLTTPTIGDFSNSTHNHTSAAGGGQITDAALSAAVGASKGGTGLTAVGTANQILGTNNAANAFEHKTLSGTTDRLTVTHGAGSITLDIAGTYVGQTSITTLGTIATGTWNATTIAIAKGGTGQTTKTEAYDALSPNTTQGDVSYFNGSDNVRLAIGTSTQVLKGGTTPSWGAVALGSDVSGTLPIGNGGTNATTAAAARTNLGLAIGSDVQAWDADLDGVAGLSTTGAITRTGAGAITTRTMTGTSNQVVITNGDGVAGNPTFGTPQDIGTASSVTFGNLTLGTGGALRTSTSSANTLLLRAYDVDGGIYVTFATLTANNTPTMDLEDSVTKAGAYIYRASGTDVAVADGGLGVSTTPSNGQIPIGNGSGYVVAAITGTSNQVTVTNGSGSITLSTPQSIHTGATPTFAALTLSNTTNQIVLGTTNTVTISSLAPGASRTATIPALAGNDSFVFLAETQTLTNKTLTTPTIGDFTNATHGHTNNAGGGTLNASAIAAGTLATARGGTNLDTSASNGLPSINAGAWSVNTITQNGVAYGGASNAISFTAQGAANSVLTANAGAPAFSASPTIGTSVTTPLVIGGTGTTSTLTLKTTTGVGAAGADMIFQVGNNGATEAMRILNSGSVGIGTAAPGANIKTQIFGVDRPLATDDSANLVITTTETATDNLGGTLGFGHNNTGALTLAVIKGAREPGSTNAGYLAFATRTDVAFATERMRIGSSGTVGINRTSIGAQLDVLASSTSTVGLIVDVPSSHAAAANTDFRYAGNSSIRLRTEAAVNRINIQDRDLGNNVAGPLMYVGRNTNAGAESGAAGAQELVQANGTSRKFWVDNTGLYRIHTAAPTGSAGTPTVSDTAGSAVGDQTSWHAFKNILRERTDPQTALAAILSTRVYDFQYKDFAPGSGYLDTHNRKQTFTGLVVQDKTEWYAKNVGRQQTPSLNEINAIGYTVLAFKAMQEQIDELKAEVHSLRARN